MSPPRSLLSKLPGLVSAWLVHGLTASCAVLAFMALLAVEEARWSAALAWLAAALIIDGIDGPLARWSRVDRVTPTISGATLDLVVDYLTFVFVPALFIYRAGLVPAALAFAAMILILVSSLYHYARSDMKTKDNFFRGFPAWWNVVAFYLYIFKLPQTANFLIICGCAALTVLPVLFVHPVRVREYRPWLPTAGVLWALSSLALLTMLLDGAGNRLFWAACMACSVACLGVLFAVGGVRTIRGWLVRA